MMLYQRFEAHIADTLSIYSDYRRSIQGVFATYIMDSAHLYPKMQPLLRGELNAVRKRHEEMFTMALQETAEYVTEKATTILVEGYQESPLGEDQIDTIDNFLTQMVSRTQESIISQMEADVEQLILQFGRFLVRLKLLESDGLSRANAIVSERQRIINGVGLYRRDALGRKRDSEQFVHVELRFMAYRTFNLLMVWGLSMLGEDKAMIVRPTHKLDGVAFDLDEYEALEQEVFHPNAMALVMPLDSNSPVSMV